MEPVSRGAVTRKLAAILIADVVGFSRHMERDDAGTFARLRETGLNNSWIDQVYLTAAYAQKADLNKAKIAKDELLRLQTRLHDRTLSRDLVLRNAGIFRSRGKASGRGPAQGRHSRKVAERSVACTRSSGRFANRYDRCSWLLSGDRERPLL
jgi:hypothetical protein